MSISVRFDVYMRTCICKCVQVYKSMCKGRSLKCRLYLGIYVQVCKSKGFLL
jgi:hypothetical protein